MSPTRDFILKTGNNFAEWIINVNELIQSTRNYVSACELLNTIREYPNYYTSEDTERAIKDACSAYEQMTISLEALGTQS